MCISSIPIISRRFAPTNGNLIPIVGALFKKTLFYQEEISLRDLHLDKELYV